MLFLSLVLRNLWGSALTTYRHRKHPLKRISTELVKVHPSIQSCSGWQSQCWSIMIYCSDSAWKPGLNVSSFSLGFSFAVHADKLSKLMLVNGWIFIYLPRKLYCCNYDPCSEVGNLLLLVPWIWIHIWKKHINNSNNNNNKVTSMSSFYFYVSNFILK